MVRRNETPGDGDYYDVSFSGLKTAVRLATQNGGHRAPSARDLARGFQDALIDTLVEKTVRAARADRAHARRDSAAAWRATARSWRGCASGWRRLAQPCMRRRRGSRPTTPR